MISVKNLSKYYIKRKAIENINFNINEGETIGLLGLNGAGKSTILKILGCFLMPSSGTATINGFSIEDSPDKIRALIGYLPDHPILYNEMTVKSYLQFVAKLKNVSSPSPAITLAMQKTEITDVQNYKLSELSHGYRQRVGIAQAIVHSPKVLILDEPISGLDPLQIIEMRDLILSFKGKHTVILSSHILSEITQTCDRILIVDKGHLVTEGKESELKTKFSTDINIICEVKNLSDNIISAINNIDGIINIEINQIPKNPDISKLLIKTSGDMRPDIAKAIINNGGDLLELRREEVGLEKLFMQFVKYSS